MYNDIVYRTPTNAFHSCQCSQLAKAHTWISSRNELARQNRSAYDAFSGIIDAVWSHQWHLHMLAVAAAEIRRIILVLPACKNPCQLALALPRPAVLPQTSGATPDLQRSRARCEAAPAAPSPPITHRTSACRSAARHRRSTAPQCRHASPGTAAAVVAAPPAGCPGCAAPRRCLGPPQQLPWTTPVVPPAG